LNRRGASPTPAQQQHAGRRPRKPRIPAISLLSVARL
jgi:hypothetical protein